MHMLVVPLKVSVRSQDSMNKPTYMSVYRPGASDLRFPYQNPDFCRLPLGPRPVPYPDSLCLPRTDRSRSYSRRSSSPQSDRSWGFGRNMHAPMPQQQPEQRHGWSKQAVGQAVADPNNHQQQQADTKGEEVPRQWRLPQPPRKRTVPAWVEDCFEKDEMARVSCETLNMSFLREGVVPEVDMNLYLQMTYAHDGSHPEHYRTWARMMGKITHVYPPPEVGVYAVYEGQQRSASDAELQQLRSALPALPPSLFGLNASCNCCRTAEQVVQKYGAVHGQRVKAMMWLTKMDIELAPQLGGFWDIELVLNDNLDSMWVMCSMGPSPTQDGDAPSDDECQLPERQPASHAPNGHTAAAAPTTSTQADIQPSSGTGGVILQGEHGSRDQQQQQGGGVRPQGHVQQHSQQQPQQRDVGRRGEAVKSMGNMQQAGVKQQVVGFDRSARHVSQDVHGQQQRDKDGRDGLGQQQQQQRGWKRERPDNAVEQPFSAKRVH